MAIQDGTALVFGVGTPTTTYGIVQSHSITETTERAEARGANGNTVSIQEFDDKKTLTMNYLLLSGVITGEPTIGTAFTFESLSWIIESIETGRTIDGFSTVDITATHFPNLP